MDLHNPHLFTPVANRASGVTFHVLTRKVAPLQKGFYFVNDCMSADGRYLWFCCAYPPALVRTLAVIDLHDQEIRHFPETQFSAETPYVDAGTGKVYWCVGNSIWQRGPDRNDAAGLVNELSPRAARGYGSAEPERKLKNALTTQGGEIKSLATHLTRSADGKSFFINAKVGLQYIFGSLPLDGGDFTFWWRFDRCYNHAQFSPVDSDLALFAEEYHPDPLTGLTFPVVDRLWLIRRGAPPRPILPEPTKVTHEWWDAAGRHVWCVTRKETWRVRISDGSVEKIEFPRHCWHSHTSCDGRLIVGDSHNGFYRGCASTVHFLNRDSGRMIVIAEHAAKHDYAGRNYHIDPHPRFCCNDQYIVFTTTIRGEVDLAVVPVRHLLDLTS